MSNNRIFRVLVLDDDQNVCLRVKKRIEGLKIQGQLDPAWPVEVHDVVLTLQEGEKGDWTFHPDLAVRLAANCARKPDLIFIDYGYVNSQVMAALRNLAASKEIVADELQGKLLTPPDLAKWIRSSSSMPEHTRRLLIKNLIESGTTVYLYSYTSREFLLALGGMNERLKKTAKAFPLSRADFD
ncbi:MAG TPA: hypothetical protein VJ843_00005 [Candidatus Saccharimonadales bacterium]|nr:hypothetical protein [Candidatus Saccharimonadales bacterium]